jgi:hypothetical protein
MVPQNRPDSVARNRAVSAVGDSVLYHSLTRFGKSARGLAALVSNADYSLKWIAAANRGPSPFVRTTFIGS